MTPPNWVKGICAFIVALGAAVVYFGPMYPTVAYWLTGVNTVLIAAGLYLGWPVPTGASAASTPANPGS